MSGALLDADADRRAAQSLLDFWSNLLYRAGHEPPDATLADFDADLAPALPDELCPYLGLDAFREDNSALFFGRQRLVADLVARLSDRRLLAIVGPSGSGKSSLVRGGLIPALKSGALPGSQGWRYLPPIVPTSEPLASLARVLVDDMTAGSPTVLVVDQFEEVFTLCEREAERHAFIMQLLALVAAPDVRNIVVLTMRSDFEAFVARVPELQELFEQGRVQVTPLSAGELREAIEQPALRIGLKFEAGVVETLLQDILGEPAGLPLLQFTLLKLWENRERNLIMLDAYRRVGGGRLALARSADAFYNNALIPEDQITAKRILLRMIRPGEGLEVTSSRVRRAALYRGGEDPGRVDRVLEKLIQARLVRLTEGDTPEDTQVEVAHEALVRNWPTLVEWLVEWLQDERAAIAARRRLEARAAEWVRLGKGSGGLLDAIELPEAERWLASPEAEEMGVDAFTPDGHYIVTGSTDKTARVWDLSFPSSINLPIVLPGHSDQVTAVAISPDAHFVITGSADKTARVWDLTAKDPAVSSLVLRGHDAGLTAVAFSPDGRRVVTGSEEATARLWDFAGTRAATGAAVLPSDPAKLIELACQTAGRNLSIAEWHEYFGQELYHKTCAQWPLPKQ